MLEHSERSPGCGRRLFRTRRSCQPAARLTGSRSRQRTFVQQDHGASHKSFVVAGRSYRFHNQRTLLALLARSERGLAGAAQSRLVNHCDRRKRRRNGDNPDRIRSEAAFAKICGVCPIPASSGLTNRHRLFRGGHRQANVTIYRVVVVRMRWHQPTIDYTKRRTAEGLSKKDIIRCLKRFVAREIYTVLITDHHATRSPATAAKSDPLNSLDI